MTSKPGLFKRSRFLGVGSALILAMWLTTWVPVVQGQTYADLYNFGAQAGGPLEPSMNLLTQGRDGNLYGMSYYGGTTNQGTVYRLTSAGNLQVLYNFHGTDGANPEGGLTLGTDGNFYGVTSYGGTHGWGTVFKITPGGALTVLYNFLNGSDGNTPYAGLVQWTDGSFYGSTVVGNESPSCPNNGGGGCGAIFKITSTGTFTVVDRMDGQLGYNIQAPLTPGTDGYLYGSTINGGNACCGTIFKMTPEGTLKFLAVTNLNQGASAYGGMAEGANGNFYGATYFFGGDVFEITPAGKYTVLHEFSSSDGDWPYGGPILTTDSNFYGATTSGGTSGNGTIYQLTQDGNFSVVYDFDGTHGGGPYATLLQHTNGKLYGTARFGGGYGQGAIYSLDMGLGPFVRLLPTKRAIGQTVGILGQGFTLATNVSFNGSPANFSVEGDTFLMATVPAGATPGAVTVTTPSGTLTSNVAFTVRPLILSFSPPSGPVGTLVTITGSGLTQATAVSFGGVKAATFTVDSDTQVTATVPAGAQTRPILIKTAGGLAVSLGSFTVTQ